VMRDLIIGDKAYLFPAYLPNTALGFQEVYGDLYNELTDIFKPEFASDIQQYYNGSITLFALNTRLISKLNAQYGSSVAKNMLQPAYLNTLLNDPNARINQLLGKNDVYKWAPKAPTKIFYCKADDQVPYLNSIVARDTMQMLGAVALEARDVNSNFDHGQCFNPALSNTILFFLSLQQITVSTSQVPLADQVHLHPNPGRDVVKVTYDGLVESVALYDMNGREVWLDVHGFRNEKEIDIQSIQSGLYILRLMTEDGLVIDKKLVKE